MRIIWRLLLIVGCLIPVIAQAAMPAIKVKIKTAGLYSISGADLIASGIDIDTIDPVNLTLRHKGQPVAIRVIGEADGQFNPDDRLVFYAAGISWDDPLSALTETNVYWLEETTIPGMRMSVSDGTPDGDSVPMLSVLTTDHVEQDKYYQTGVNYPASAERWFMAGPVHEGESVSLPFTLTQTVDSTQPATITVYLQGHTDVFDNPDHHSQVTVNGCALGGGQYWDGFTSFAQQETIPAGCLTNGTNTLTLYNPGDTGAIIDGWMVDSFDIAYTQTGMAKQDGITFTATAPVRVSGFSTSDVDIYAITDTAHVRYLVNADIGDTGTGFDVSIDDPDDSTITPETYQLLTAGQYKSPAGLVIDTPSSLKSDAHSVDYIIIAHAAFLGTIQPLVDHRRDQGLRVEVVDIVDIYDEFSDGLQTDQAIRDFLSYAYHHWQVKPVYVLLVGDATINFKSKFPDHVPTYVPTHFYRAYDGAMVPSDNWFVTVDGDDPLPDMLIGRLPVTANIVDGKGVVLKADDSHVVVDKIIAYDQPSKDRQWMNRAFFIADDDEPAYETVSDEIAAILSPQYVTNKVYLGRVNEDRQTDDLVADKRNAIKNYLMNGNVITTYTGHGSTSLWGLEGLYSSDDVDFTTNPDRLTFMVALNCLSSYFVRPSEVKNQLSLAEAFMTSDKGGAIATWAAGYLGFASDHQIMGSKLFTSIKQQGSQRLGAVTTQALVEALSAGASADTLDSYIYFGDPATVLASQRVIKDNGDGGGGVVSVFIVLVGLMLYMTARGRKRFAQAIRRHPRID